MDKAERYFIGDREARLGGDIWMDPRWALLINRMIGDRIEAEGAEALTSTVLNSVGVGDFNKALDVLDDDVLATIQLVPFVQYEIGETAKRAYLTALGEEVSSCGFEYQDGRYPIFNGGMVDKLASTAMFQRLNGVNQINIVGWYPLRNKQTRAPHSINVAVYMLRALQTIYDKDKAALVKRVRTDFASSDIDMNEMDDESLIVLTARITAATGMLHDLFTPAWGDLMKRVVGMNEEEDIELLLSSQDESVEEVRRCLAEFGITGDFLTFVISCIKGESSSLVGDMIHPSDNTNVLDIDQVAYTLWDAAAAGIVGGPKLRGPLDRSLSVSQKNRLMFGIEQAENSLGDSLPSAGAAGTSKSRLLPLSSIDPVGGYFLNEEGELINDRPDILLAVMALRLFMSTEMYRGTKMKGFDKDLEAVLKETIDSGKYDHIFSKENLLKQTNEGLTKQLIEIADDPNLPSLLLRTALGVFSTRYASEVVEVDEENQRDGIRFNFRTGMDSLVSAEDGSIMTLSEFAARKAEDSRRSEEDPIVDLISKLRARYNEDTIRIIHGNGKDQT